MRPARTRSAATRLVAALLTLTAFVALAAGCGVKKDATGAPVAEPFDLVLDFFPNADHAGIYQALSDGAFRRAGLAVKPQTPSDPAAPLKLLAAGRADLAISYEPEVLLARDRGLRVVAVGALVQRPLTSVIALGSSPVKSVAGLRGRRVGTAGIPYQSAYLRTILAHANVKPTAAEEVSVGFNLVPAMLSRRVDATLGGFWNYEGIQLALQHRNPTVIRVDQAGVPTYDELVFVAREDEVRTQGGRIRRFMRAVTAGYEAARRDPAAAVDALLSANHDLDRALQLASLRATLPAFFPASANHPFGFQDQGQWRAYGDWMLRNGLLKRPADLRALTNEFLPGQGV